LNALLYVRPSFPGELWAASESFAVVDSQLILASSLRGLLYGMNKPQDQGLPESS
jgi:hypothetical protein